MPENTATVDQFNPDERRQLHDALRRPRGRYRTERAAQLSGIPARTLSRWARDRVIVPDFRGRPSAWSYRDLIYARLLVGLRMPRDEATALVHQVRRHIELEHDPAGLPGVELDIGDGRVDRLSGPALVDHIAAYTAALDLAVGRRRLSLDLVHPSSRTLISPAVMAGEPCVRGTRIPTATLYALAVERELGAHDITRLYPGLVAADVEDAIALERRLRAA